MTKTEAAEIITAALASAGHINSVLSADAFASRLATALDALGLLQFCDIADSGEATPAAVEDTGAKSPGTEFFEKRDRSR